MKRRYVFLAFVLWILWLILLDPPKRFEDLTPEERLMLDIEATTPIF